VSITTSRWDASEYLDTPEDVVAYLNAAVEEKDPALLQAALGDVAKAKGMAQIARDAGVGRESLYKSLSADGTPSLKTIVKVAQALGVRITFELMPQSDQQNEAALAHV
jgi:probable addiction module antidote protein